VPPIFFGAIAKCVNNKIFEWWISEWANRVALGNLFGYRNH
jgi:hypothetical protein